MLNCITVGNSDDKPPLLIAHGLYGSGRNWGIIAKRLSDSRQVVAVDMRNHGQSDWFDTHTYPDMANDLGEVIDAFGGRMDVLGHSMGGKAAMVLALAHPEKVNRLIVADIAPVSYGHTQIHLIDAMNSVPLDQIDKRSDADIFLAKIIVETGVRSFVLQSLDVSSKSWRLNLGILAMYMDDIIGFPDVNGSYSGPTLFLSGGDSDYVKRDYRPLIKPLFSAARFAKIPGAGHWLHAEKPREFEAAVRAFLDS